MTLRAGLKTITDSVGGHGTRRTAECEVREEPEEDG